jgi:ClpP class serine protease
MARPWDSTETDALQRYMDGFYDDFISKVAAGRRMPKARVDSLGQGRIYTGAQGAANGLVDRLGGLEDAIEEARKRAGLGRDAEPVVFSAQGETGVLPYGGRDWAHARLGTDAFAERVKAELGRIESLAKADLWAISPELAGWEGAVPPRD